MLYSLFLCIGTVSTPPVSCNENHPKVKYVNSHPCNNGYSNKSDGQSIRLNIISEGSELALEANGLFYELAYTHINHPICL